VTSSAPTILSFPSGSKSAGGRAMRKDFLRALRASGPPVIVDFTGCSPLNHDDIDLVLECVAEVAGRDTQVLLAAGSRVNRVLLEVTRIASLVPVFSSVEEVLICSPAYSKTMAASGSEDFRANQSQNPWSEYPGVSK
jgi:hypothetical protein